MILKIRIQQFVLILAIIGTTVTLNAQSIKRQTISSYGSSTTNGNITVSQTAGQSYNTISTSNNNTAVLQGFQQPNKFIIEDITIPGENNLNLGVFPNPAIYAVTLTSETEIPNAYISVFDATGQLVFVENIENFTSNQINCSDWSAGTYLISVSDRHNSSKTLRLIISK